MNFSEDVVSVVGSYLEEIEDLNNLSLTSKDFHQATSNSLFWQSLNFSIEVFKHRRMMKNLVEKTIQNIKENSINNKHIQILKASIKQWSLIQAFDYNIFSHPLILEFEKKEIEYLNSMGYPLSVLRFKSTNESLKMYLAHKNEFTLLHHAVWTENKEICHFLCQNKFKIEYDMLEIQPYVYSLRIGNKEIINILKPSHIEKFNENETLIIKNEFQSNIEKDIEEMEISEDESFLEKDNQPRTKNYTNLKETIIDFSSSEEDDSEPDLEEETIQLQKILDSSVEEISKEIDLFERVHFFGIPDSYTYRTFVETVSRKPSKKRRESNPEENPSKKRKLENPATRSSEVILSKYSINPVINEVGEDFKNNIKFTPLAYLILQQISENLLGSFFQEIEILQTWDFLMKKLFNYFLFLTNFKREIKYIWKFWMKMRMENMNLNLMILAVKKKEIIWLKKILK
jgi:hypothetical protein